MHPLVKHAVNVAIGKAEVKAKGTCIPPPLDWEAIKARADELDPKSQLKTDLYILLLEVKRLTNGNVS